MDNYCGNVYETTEIDSYHDQYEIDSEFKEYKKSKLQSFKRWFNDIGRLSNIVLFEISKCLHILFLKQKNDKAPRKDQRKKKALSIVRK